MIPHYFILIYISNSEHNRRYYPANSLGLSQHDINVVGISSQSKIMEPYDTVVCRPITILSSILLKENKSESPEKVSGATRKVKKKEYAA